MRHASSVPTPSKQCLKHPEKKLEGSSQASTEKRERTCRSYGFSFILFSFVTESDERNGVFVSQELVYGFRQFQPLQLTKGFANLTDLKNLLLKYAPSQASIT